MDSGEVREGGGMLARGENTYWDPHTHTRTHARTNPVSDHVRMREDEMQRNNTKEYKGMQGEDETSQLHAFIYIF